MAAGDENCSKICGCGRLGEYKLIGVPGGEESGANPWVDMAP